MLPRALGLPHLSPSCAPPVGDAGCHRIASLPLTSSSCVSFPPPYESRQARCRGLLNGKHGRRGAPGGNAHDVSSLSAGSSCLGARRAYARGVRGSCAIGTSSCTSPASSLSPCLLLS